MKTYLIYKAENISNGKCYVGRTSATLAKRRSWHYSNAKKRNADGYINNSKFFAALRECPKEDISWATLEQGLSKADAFERETYYIKKYRCCEAGYNEKPGDLIPWNKGKKMSEEYRHNLKGEHNGMYGKTHSDAYKKWRSELMKQSQLGSSNCMAKKVVCRETGKTWGSVSECAREMGIGADNIASCCNPNRRNKSAGGFHFEYL